MTTHAKESVVTTRRERQRAATHDEIVTVARRLLGSPDALSLRAVAAEMGLTAPALYRYVDSYHELLMLVAQAIFQDVISAMTSARDRHGDDDPAAQLIASTVAFRRWALRHPGEFGLIFANANATATFASAGAETGSGSGSGSAESLEPADPSAPGSGAQFAEFFTDIFLRVWDRYQFAVPSDSDLEPALLERLRDQRACGALTCDFPGHPLGLSWIFIRSWARLYGTVTLEVFKHLDPGVIESGALFRAMLDDNGRDLGFEDDSLRLRALTEAEMGR